MALSTTENKRESMSESPWVARFAGRVAAGGTVLDLAAGGGRHTRFFRGRGHPVVAVDRDVAALAAIGDPNVAVIAADLEGGAPWPLAARQFAAVVVTNYLHRPLFAPLCAALEDGGVLIYETFARGQERYGRPKNPEFLLRPGELLEVARTAGLRVVAYEDLVIEEPAPRCVQHICAVRQAAEGTLLVGGAR